MSHFVIQYELHIPNHEVHQIFELRLWQLLEAWIAPKRGRDGFDAFLEPLALRRLLISARRRRGKLRLGQCGDRRWYSNEGDQGGEGGDRNHESAHGGLPLE